MSAYRHRQPIWNWSSVVLLSTLLLSPVAAATLLHAVVAQSLSHPTTAAAVPNNTTAEVSLASTPRRVEDNENAPSEETAGQRRFERWDEETETLVFRTAAYRSLAQTLLFVALLSPAAAPPRFVSATPVTFPFWRDASLSPRDTAYRVGPSRAPPLFA